MEQSDLGSYHHFFLINLFVKRRKFKSLKDLFTVYFYCTPPLFKGYIPSQ